MKSTIEMPKTDATKYHDKETKYMKGQVLALCPRLILERVLTISLVCFILLLVIFTNSVYCENYTDDFIQKKSKSLIGRFDISDQTVIDNISSELDLLFGQYNQSYFYNKPNGMEKENISKGVVKCYNTLVEGLFAFEGKFNENISRNIRNYINSRSEDGIKNDTMDNNLVLVADDFLPLNFEISSPLRYWIKKHYSNAFFCPDNTSFENFITCSIQDLNSKGSEARTSALFFLEKMPDEKTIDAIRGHIINETNEQILNNMLDYLERKQVKKSAYGFLNRVRTLKFKIDIDKLAMLTMADSTDNDNYINIFNELILLLDDTANPNYKCPVSLPGIVIGDEYKSTFHYLLFIITGLNKDTDKWKALWEKIKTKDFNYAVDVIVTENITNYLNTIKNNPLDIMRYDLSIRISCWLNPDKMNEFISERINKINSSESREYMFYYNHYTSVAGGGNEKALRHIVGILDQDVTKINRIDKRTTNMINILCDKINNRNNPICVKYLEEILLKSVNLDNEGEIINNILNTIFKLDNQECYNVYINCIAQSKNINAITFIINNYILKYDKKDIRELKEYKLLLESKLQKDEEISATRKWWHEYLIKDKKK
jgi:hypothetical protein